MQTVPDAWLTAAQSTAVKPVLYVELVGTNGPWFATHAVAGTPRWRVGEGLVLGAGTLVGDTRGPYQTLLAPYEQAVGALRVALDDRTGAPSVSGTTVQLLNQGGLATQLDALALDNAAIQIALGFVGLDVHHTVIVLRGTVDDWAYDRTTLTLRVTDDGLRWHRNLSTTLGLRYAPDTPRSSRGRTIPLLLGRQQGIEAIQIAGPVGATLALPMSALDTVCYLTEYDAPLPTSGTITIDGETGITYSGRTAQQIAGIPYLRLDGLSRGSPSTHAADAAVTLEDPVYRYLVGYEAGAVTAVRDDDTLLDPLTQYSVTLAYDIGTDPVTVVELDTAPSGAVTVDADGVNVRNAGQVSNGDFETGDATGWTAGSGSTLDVTTGDQSVFGSVYHAEHTGDEDAYADVTQDFSTEPERYYTLELMYHDTLLGNLIDNGDFHDGLTGWSEVTALVDDGAASVADGACTLSPTTVTDRTFRYGLSTDVTTVIGETYALSLSVKGAAIFPHYPPPVPSPVTGWVALPVATYRLTNVGWRLGTTSDPVAYADQPAQTRPFGDIIKAQQGWLTLSDVATFVATTTTTRVTVEAYGTASFMPLAPLQLSRVALVQQTHVPSSTSAVQLGTAADPSAYADVTLTQSYQWTRRQFVFQAASNTTRLTLRSQWRQLETPTHWDNVRLFDAGRNPAEAIAYVIDTYLPDLQRDRASFDDAYQRLMGWQFNAYVPDPGWSKPLLERMAAQCKSLLITSADGVVKLVTFGTDRTPVRELTPATIVEDSLSVSRETLDNFYTDIYVYYGLRTGQAPQSPESYQGVTYATPEGTTHATEALDALCSYGATRTRVRRRLDVTADMIRDLDTADLLLAHLVEQHTTRHTELTLTTWLSAAVVDLGDLVHVAHPLLSQNQPQLCQVRSRSVTATTVALSLRVLQQAGFYEPWEPPPPLLPGTLIWAETWAPSQLDILFTVTEDWEPPGYTEEATYTEEWES